MLDPYCRLCELQVYMFIISKSIINNIVFCIDMIMVTVSNNKEEVAG